LKDGANGELEKVEFRTNYEKGFADARKMADIGWCMFFFVILASVVFFTVCGVKYGNYKKFIAPVDGDFRICGVDKQVEDYPYLYLAKMDSMDIDEIFSNGVCVKSCP
jgi:hypothetical protein